MPAFLETIEHCTFKNCSSLESAILPDGVTTIEYDAFLNCTSLTNIELPETVTTIGDNAFMNTKIKSITLPASLKEIGKGIFEGSSELTELNLPKDFGVLNLNDTIVSEQENLDNIFKINLGEGTTEIESLAFNNCNNLVFIGLPKSLTKYGYGCFNDCNSLVTVKYAGDIASWCYNEFKMDILLVINKFNTPMVVNPLYFAKRFYANNKLVNILNIPDSVTKINDYAFCRAPISEVNISGSVKSIGTNAFSYCDMNKIIFQSGLEKLGSYAFTNCKKITSIVLPNTIKQIGDRCFSDCKNLESFAFNGEFTFKAFGLLYGCDKLKKVFVKSKETLKNICDDTTAEVFFYSENKPNEQGKFWHFVDDVSTIW